MNASATLAAPSSALDRLIDKAGQLYSLPAVAMKVLELTNNPEVDTQALKKCIENDPALTGKVLRVVNSSLFGLSGEVSDLNQALALLGTKPLKLLVLGFSLPGELFANIHGEVLGCYWRHTLTKAVAAREISEKVFRTPGDDAFIAGLLQDLGILLLIQELGETYVNFLEKVTAAGKNATSLEVELMGFDRTTASARLLAHWGLPDAIVDAVDQHSAEHGEHSPEGALPQIVHLAELVAQLLADHRPEVLSQLLEVGRDYRELSEEQLETLVGNLQEKVVQLADVLSLQLPKGLDYRDVLAQAHTQLAGVANDAAEALLLGKKKAVERSQEESILTEFKGLAKAMIDASNHPPQADDSAAASVEPTAPQRTTTADVDAVQYGRSVDAHSTSSRDADLPGRLAVAAAACRQSRCSLSLLLVELDKIDQLTASLGEEAALGLRRSLEEECRNLDHPCTICVGLGISGFAVILPDCERGTAVRLGSQLIDDVRRWPPADDSKRPVPSISVGVAAVALPPKNFNGEGLLTAAERCLYGSQASGGGVVKSIEIY